MIAQQKYYWLNRRMAAKETITAAKGRGQTVNLGVASKAIMDGKLNVSTRYDVLNAINGDNENRGVEANKEGEQRGKEMGDTKTNMIEGSVISKENG